MHAGDQRPGHERDAGRGVQAPQQRVQPQLRAPRTIHVRREVQRAAVADPGGGRVQLQAEARLQAGTGPQHNAGRGTIDLQRAYLKNARRDHVPKQTADIRDS